MDCRRCGYQLWNLTEPRCPECGEAFDLRSYRFRPDTVAFACPYCGAQHRGAGEAYLPSTDARATCQACGRDMPVASMRVVPLTDPPTPAIADRLPWERADELGFWRAWYQTFKLTLSAPSQVVRQLLPTSTVGRAYRFATWCYFLPAIVYAALLALLFVSLWLAAPGSTSGSPGGWFALAWFPVFSILCVVAGFSLIGPLLVIVFGAMPAHLFLMVFEPHRQPWHHTARAYCYAQGPLALMAIPVCGFYLAGVFQIWSLVAAILMLKAEHGISGLKATVAALWAPLLMMGLMIAMQVLVLTTRFGVSGPGSPMIVPMPSTP